MSEAISPETSATPTPIMMTRMIPIAVNPMRLLTNEVNRYRIPLDGQQALDPHRLVDHVVGTGRRRLGRQLVGGQHGPADILLLHRGRRRLDHLGGDAGAARYKICDRMMTATQSAPNKIAGCGTLLPTRSTRSSMPLGFFSALTS
jgi:hypothetical protein